MDRQELLRGIAQEYVVHDKKRREAILRGDREAVKASRAEAINAANKAFDAGFTLGEFNDAAKRERKN